MLVPRRFLNQKVAIDLYGPNFFSLNAIIGTQLCKQVSENSWKPSIKIRAENNDDKHGYNSECLCKVTNKKCIMIKYLSSALSMLRIVRVLKKTIIAVSKPLISNLNHCS